MFPWQNITAKKATKARFQRRKYYIGILVHSFFSNSQGSQRRSIVTATWLQLSVHSRINVFGHLHTYFSHTISSPCLIQRCRLINSNMLFKELAGKRKKALPFHWVLIHVKKCIPLSPKAQAEISAMYICMEKRQIR